MTKSEDIQISVTQVKIQTAMVVVRAMREAEEEGTAQENLRDQHKLDKC